MSRFARRPTGSPELKSILLLAQAGDVQGAKDMPEPERLLALRLLAINNEISAAQTLLDVYREDAAKLAAHADGLLLLHAAYRFGHKDIVRLLAPVLVPQSCALFEKLLRDEHDFEMQKYLIKNIPEKDIRAAVSAWLEVGHSSSSLPQAQFLLSSPPRSQSRPSQYRI